MISPRPATGSVTHLPATIVQSLSQGIETVAFPAQQLVVERRDQPGRRTTARTPTLRPCCIKVQGPLGPGYEYRVRRE